MSTEPPLRLVVIAEDPLVRAGLAGLLKALPMVARLEETDPPSAADTTADVAVWDFSSGEETRLLRDAVQAGLCILVLVDSNRAAAEALDAGARGALARTAEAELIAAALLAAHRGALLVDASFRAALIARRDSAEHGEELTVRESEVLALLAQGLSNKLIASQLGVSENTIKFHVNSILGKLGADTRTEAVVRAARKGLVLL